MTHLQKLQAEIAETLTAFFAAIDMPVEEHEGDEGALLAPFGYGMVLAITNEQGLGSADVHVLTIGFLKDVLRYDDDQAEEVAELLIHAAKDPSLHPYHAIIQHGIKGYEQWIQEDEDALVQNFEEINQLIDSPPQGRDERLRELVTKSQAGEATSQEQEELLHTLYMGTLSKESDSEPRFVSKHRMKQTDVVARIKAINWFAHCGEPCNFDLTMEVEYVKTWAQAMKALKSRAWENAKVDADNQLSEFLAIHHRERYNTQWNELNAKYKSAIVTPLMEKVWEPFQEKNDLDYSIVSSTMWCVLAALMENAYMDCNHNSFFFLELLTVYEAGHLPCGWRGEWPEGRLIVF